MAKQKRTSSQNSAGHIYNCEIPIKFVTLNGYVDMCRKNKYQAAAYKKKIEYEISCFLHKLPKFNNPVAIEFYWHEADRRRDPDNIAFAKKFILDALVANGNLRNDTQKYVKGFSDHFVQDKETKVVLKIKED